MAKVEKRFQGGQQWVFHGLIEYVDRGSQWWSARSTGIAMVWHVYSMPLLQALVASASISVVTTTPLTPSSPMASTTASATRSTFNGFSTAAPANHVNRPPIMPLTILPALPANAIGRVNLRELSYRNPGRMKMLLSFGSDEAIVDSASLFVVIYRFGSIGAPAAADMKTNDGTFWKDASWARVIARGFLGIRLIS